VAEAGPAGWLALRFEQRAGRTVLAHRSHEGPLAVQKPFYPEGDVCQRLPAASAGRCGRQRSAGYRDRGRERRPRGDHHARGGQVLPFGGTRFDTGATSVGRARAVLEWLPQESILYAGCRASLSTRVTLVPGARFIGWEVLCLGRPAAGERFDAGLCRQRLELWCEDRPLVIERSTIAGASEL
jgi:urease accessory protein